MKNRNQNLWKTIVFSSVLILFSACGDEKKDEVSPSPQSNNNSDSNNLESKLLECNLPEGETLTLTNRNNQVDYIVDCKYIISGHLNIEENVTIEFQSDAGFSVNSNGYLHAKGTEKAPITFTGLDKTKGSWRGIFFDSNHVNNELTHTIIEYAGGNSFNSNDDRGSIIVYAGAKLKANNNTLKNGKEYGINLSYSASDVIINNNKITTHKAPMFIQGQYVDKVVGGTYVGNVTDAILINNYTSVISDDCRWRKLDVPYHILDRLVVVAGGGHMTVDAGVIMAFAADTGLEINEGASGTKPSLIAVGTEDEPIIFTGLNKVKGAWKGFYFDSPHPSNEIAFSRIEYASTPSQKGAVEVWADTVLSIHDVEFKDILNCAVHGGNIGYLDDVTTSNILYTNTGGGLCEG